MYKFEDKPLEIIDSSLIEGCVCEDVIPEEMDDIIKLGELMIKLCTEKGGLGLAAPQIGIMKRMFVWANAQNQFQIIVNPMFFPDDKTTNVVEGCLSYPEKHFFLKRFKAGNARSDILDPKNKTKFKRLFKKISGERSLVWQHETDHVNGKTISMIGKPFEIGENNGRQKNNQSESE
jgi:peptide deformylase